MNKIILNHLILAGFFCLLLTTVGCDGKVSLPAGEPTRIPTVTVTSKVTPTQPPVPSQTSNSEWEVVNQNNSANQIRVMLFDNSGDLWAGGPGGLVHWNLETGIPTIYVFSAEPEASNVVALAQTPDGTLWIGTYGHGLFRFDGETWKKFTSLDGIPGDYLISVSATKDGNVWVDTYKTKYRSVDMRGYFGRFDGQTWVDGVGGGFLKILSAPEGTIWGASRDFGVTRWEGSHWGQGELTDETITAMTVDPEGRVWIATETAIFQFDGATWTEITAIAPWIERTSVMSIGVMQNDTAWFGMSFNPPFLLDTCGIRRDTVEESGVYRFEGKNWTNFTTEDGLVDNKICYIAVGLDESVWFGSFDKGISRFDGNEWTSFIVP